MKEQRSAGEKEQYYRKMFHVAALWNWCAAAPFYFFWRPIFGVLRMRTLAYPVFARLFLALVAAFGYGYYQVSRDIRQNHAVVKMGILGKLWVFLLFLNDGIRGRIPLLLVVPGIVDFVFAVLFIDFLRSREGQEGG